jgi:hypothetical protein
MINLDRSKRQNISAVLTPAQGVRPCSEALTPPTFPQKERGREPFNLAKSIPPVEA